MHRRNLQEKSFSDLILFVNNRNSSEPRKAQSQVSQEFSNNTENSTVESQKQVDSITKATIENQQTVSGDSSNSETPNSEGNTNSFARSEDSNSDIIISSFNNSNASSEFSEQDLLDIFKSKSPVLFQLPYTIVSPEQLDDSVDSFIENTGDIYLLRAQELLECDDSLSYDLAVKTIKGAKRNAESGWVLTGIAAYRVWNNTSALPGGAGNVAAPDEGRMNALEELALDCSQNGSPVKAKTLYDYVRRIKVFLEEPLQAFAGSDEKTIRRERTVLMQRLFAVPGSFVRVAVATTKPLEALEIACEKRASATGKSFTCSDYKTSIKHLEKDANINQNEDGDGQNGETNFDETVLDAGDDNGTAVALPRAGVKKTEKSSDFEQVFASQISSEAKRVKLNPEQVKRLYVSFLQTMLSTVQNMGVEK